MVFADAGNKCKIRFWNFKIADPKWTQIVLIRQIPKNHEIFQRVNVNVHRKFQIVATFATFLSGF